MRIILNGRPEYTDLKTLFELRDVRFSPDCIAILNGFQTNDDMVLHDGDTIGIIKKGVMPPHEELESMMAARHTTGGS